MAKLYYMFLESSVEKKTLIRTAVKLQ